MLALVSAAILVLPGTALAASGDVDTSFSHDGVQYVNFGKADSGHVAAMQGNKIVVAGISGFGRNENIAVARLNAGGGLDTTFSGDGKLTINVGGNIDEMGHGLLIQPDNKIVIAGDSFFPSSGEKAFVLRLNPNGGIDHSFGGGDGRNFAQFNSQDALMYDVALQSNGKIIVAGESDVSSSASTFLLVRFNPNGSLDKTFGSKGLARTKFLNGYNFAYSLAVTPTDKIVACGWTGPFGASDTAVARYTRNGRLDTTFSGDGKVVTNLGGDDGCDAVALLPNGKVLAGDRLIQGGNQNMGFLRYTATGHLDSTFTGDGKQILDFGGPENVNSITLQSDGKILVAGAADVEHFALVRLKSGGSVDFGFGDNGVASPPLRPSVFDPSASDVVIQPNGRIVVAGDVGDHTIDFAVARFLP